MCGIFALYYDDKDRSVVQGLIDGLTLLQHRGQDAAGIMVGNKKNKLSLRKDLGMIPFKY